MSHSGGQAPAQIFPDFRSNTEIVPKVGEKMPSGFFQPGQGFCFVIRQQTGADVECAGPPNPAIVDDAHFRRSAANVNVQNRQTFFAAFENRSGAVGRHDCL